MEEVLYESQSSVSECGAATEMAARHNTKRKVTKLAEC